MYADDDAASRPLSYGVSPKPAALKDQRLDAALTIARADSSRVRVRGAPKTDLLAPAGRRFANFVFAIFRLGANDRWSSGVRGEAGAAAAAPGARWMIRPTRWRRLLAAVADSLFLGWGRTLEFGRSGVR